MDYGVLYVQVQEEVSTLLLRVLEAKDKIEVSRYFAQSQATLKSLFFQGVMQSEEVTRLQQLHSMRYLLHGKRLMMPGDGQVAQAYSAVNAEITKLLKTTVVTKPVFSPGIYEYLVENYQPRLPEPERIAETLSLIASASHLFATDPLIKKVLDGCASPLESLNHSGITQQSQDPEESDEDIREFARKDYRSEALRRLLSQ